MFQLAFMQTPVMLIEEQLVDNSLGNTLKQLPQQNNKTVQDQTTPKTSRTCLQKLREGLKLVRKCLSQNGAAGDPFSTKFKKYLYGITSLILTAIVYYNNHSLQQNCPLDSHNLCLTQFVIPKLIPWIFKIAINTACILTQVCFLLHQRTYLVVSVFGLSPIVYLYFWMGSTNSPRSYFGALSVIQVTVMAVTILIYLMGVGLVVCYRKNKRLLLLPLLILAAACIAINFLVLNPSCEYWQNGINGKIQKIPGLCNIKTPPYCWYKILDGCLGLSWLFNDCHLGPESKTIFNRYFQSPLSQGPFIAFANPLAFSQVERCESKMQNSTIHYSRGFHSLEAAKSSQIRPDIVFDSENQKYYIEIQKNETLIKERAELWQKVQTSDSPPLAKNVLFLYIDAVSRQSTHLKLPKLVTWFQKQAVFKSYERDNSINESNEKVPQLAEGEAYEFYRFNSVKPWTQPNHFNMFYGVDIYDAALTQRLKKNKKSSITKAYMEKGYVTGASNSFCESTSAYFEDQEISMFETTRFDHEGHAFACDPNFQDPEHFYGNAQGPYSAGKRCLYGQPVANYVTDYTLGFFQTYKAQPKFFSMEFLEGHEGTSQGVKSLDEPISNFLRKMESKGLLDDTMVVLVSDHGLHMEGVYSILGVQSFYTEKNLPVLMVRLPRVMNSQYRDKIRMNQQYLITSQNVFHLLMQTTEGKRYGVSELSLLNDLSGNSCCANVGIESLNYCSCKQ